MLFVMAISSVSLKKKIKWSLKRCSLISFLVAPYEMSDNGRSARNKITRFGCSPALATD